MPLQTIGWEWQDQGYFKEVVRPGWTADARSIAEMSANGQFTFSVGQATGIVCGLNSNNATFNYYEIDHGFYIEAGRAKVIENGVYKTAFTTYTPTTSVFKISRIENIVRYYLDDVLIYTSLVSSTGMVFLDCSLYAKNDEILDMAYGPAEDETEFGPTLDITLPGIVTEIYDVGSGAGAEFFDCTMPALTVELEEADTTVFDITLPGLEVELIAGTDVFFDITLPALEVEIYESLIVPEWATLDIELPLTVVLIEKDMTPEAELDITLPGLEVDCHDFANGMIDIELPGIEVYLEERYLTGLILGWPRWTLTISEAVGTLQNAAHLRMPAPRLHATASSTNNRAKLRMPAPRLHGTGGASAALHMPAPRLTATASGPTQATAALRMPAPRLTATATTGIAASAQLRMPAPRLTAQGGANAALRMPLPRLTGVATVAQTANGHLRMPLPRLTGIATVSAVAFGHLRMPMPRLHGGIGNVGHLRMPMPRLTATATSLAVGVVTLSVPYAATAAALDAGEVTTYAVNLNTGAVTTLLLGGFDSLATAHGILYGIRNGTLYTLAGDVDGASTAIPMTLRFAQQDFGTNLVKRISTVYLSSREDNGITLDLIQDEKTAWRYQTATDTAPAYGTHKLKVGRGVAFHTAGLIVKNRAGGKLDLGGMEFLIEQLSRKPR